MWGKLPQISLLSSPEWDLMIGKKKIRKTQKKWNDKNMRDGGKKKPWATEPGRNVLQLIQNGMKKEEINEVVSKC